MRTATLSWLRSGDSTRSRGEILYCGDLCGRSLQLVYGFDGWRLPVRRVPLQPLGSGMAVAEISGLDGHLALDCAVTDGERWDNNSGADYRLWIGFEPIDAHLHVGGDGYGPLGVQGLGVAMASAGISCGITSWHENHLLDKLDHGPVRLFPLVWVKPGETSVRELRARLNRGAVGIKLHPAIDSYRADDSELDRYLDIASDFGCSVACHTAPGNCDPDRIRRLAERFPWTPLVMYHTFLGPDEGRWRAAMHVREQPNLYLETSWCGWRVVAELVEQVGAERVMFGSDASADGPYHYHRSPPNVEGRETYKEGLLSLAKAIGRSSARQVMATTARRLFRLDRRAGF